MRRRDTISVGPCPPLSSLPCSETAYASTTAPPRYFASRCGHQACNGTGECRSTFHVKWNYLPKCPTTQSRANDSPVCAPDASPSELCALIERASHRPVAERSFGWCRLANSMKWAARYSIFVTGRITEVGTPGVKLVDPIMQRFVPAKMAPHAPTEFAAIYAICRRAFVSLATTFR